MNTFFLLSMIFMIIVNVILTVYIVIVWIKGDIRREEDIPHPFIIAIFSLLLGTPIIILTIAFIGYSYYPEELEDH